MALECQFPRNVLPLFLLVTKLQYIVNVNNIKCHSRRKLARRAINLIFYSRATLYNTMQRNEANLVHNCGVYILMFHQCSLSPLYEGHELSTTLKNKIKIG